MDTKVLNEIDYNLGEDKHGRNEMSNYPANDMQVTKEKKSNYGFTLFMLSSEIVFAIVSLLPPRDLFTIAKGIVGQLFA